MKSHNKFPVLSAPQFLNSAPQIRPPNSHQQVFRKNSKYLLTAWRLDIIMYLDKYLNTNQ